MKLDGIFWMIDHSILSTPWLRFSHVPLFCINHTSEEGVAGGLFLLLEIHRGKLSSGA